MQAEPAIELNPALIVEDDPAMQRRLHALLLAVAGAGSRAVVAGDVAGAKTRLREGEFGLALVDIGLPDGSGTDLIAWMHAHCPQTSCVVITCWGDEETVLAALRAGAIGYLLKDRDDAELALALQSIQRGGAPIDPFVARRILALLSAEAGPARMTPQSSAAPHPDDTLSRREREILRLVAAGHSNREIAELTALSRFTIEGYTKAIYRKLAVGSRTAAVFAARSRGLLR